jgi:hypothetical protein
LNQTKGKKASTNMVASATHVLSTNGSLIDEMEASVACTNLQYTQKSEHVPHQPAAGNACP